MDVELDSKTYPCSKVATVENKSSLVKPYGQNMKLTGSHSGTMSIVKAELNEEAKSPKSHEDAVVDITGCMNASDERSAKVEDGDTTEYSSSFDGTIPDAETFPGLGEAEVESQHYDDNSLTSAFGAFGNVLSMRKKKLTAHWRKFVRPLMWRCKWAELRIKEIKSQSAKYAKELAAYGSANCTDFDQSVLDGFGLKSLPYFSNSYRKETMKRRKRKRVEDTTDVSSFLSQQNLFSFLENKSSDPDGPSMADDLILKKMADDFNNSVITHQNDNDSDNFSINNDMSFSDLRDHRESLESVLFHIEKTQSWVQKLKNHLDMMMSKHGVKFNSSEDLSLLEQTSSLPSPTFSTGDGDIISSREMYGTIQHMSEYDFGDLVLPESAVSSYGEGNPVPDIIESTAGMLSAAEVTIHQPQTRDSREIIVDNVHLHQEVTESSERHPFSASILDHATECATSMDQSAPMPRLGSDFHFPNKRKRGERKAGSGGWSKRHSCDPDSL